VPDEFDSAAITTWVWPDC